MKLITAPRLIGLAVAALAGCLVVLPSTILAQHNHGTSAAMPMSQAKAGEMAEGEVRRIDAEKGTVLLKHGEIKSLNMGAMTMGFKFKDPAMGAGLKVGDKVRFAAEMKGEQLIVTQIQKVN